MRVSRWFIAVAAASAACKRDTRPDAYGNIEATEVVVGAQASGQLVAFTPNTGDQVECGTVAAVVDTSALVLQLQQIMAQGKTGASRVDEAARQIGVVDVQRTIAERTYDRTRASAFWDTLGGAEDGDG